MSDPIAAAEAAGKARDIANRFETAVFLIAYGIAEKDGLYEADPHRYPYSQAFRHGMNILAALCAECSDDAEELLPTFNESDFIRNSAASDVREWTARWRDECREAVEGCRSIEIGPLASVDGDYFAATSECYEVLRFAENDLLGGHQERRVYEFLRAGTQEQYVYGRRMLIRHPLLTWNEYVRIKTGLALGDPDPLDQGEADTIDPVWLQEFVSMAYEPVPGAAKVCPNCGWTMTMRGKQPHCSSATCAKAVTGDFDKLDSVAHDAFRLSRGVMHYISSPGKLELAIAEAAAGLGLKYEMWPLKDTCDILIHLPDGRQLAVDAEDEVRGARPGNHRIHLPRREIVSHVADLLLDMHRAVGFQNVPDHGVPPLRIYADADVWVCADARLSVCVCMPKRLRAHPHPHGISVGARSPSRPRGQRRRPCRATASRLPRTRRPSGRRRRWRPGSSPASPSRRPRPSPPCRRYPD